jgi:hypothetical protein
MFKSRVKTKTCSFPKYLIDLSALTACDFKIINVMKALNGLALPGAIY